MSLTQQHFSLLQMMENASFGHAPVPLSKAASGWALTVSLACHMLSSRSMLSYVTEETTWAKVLRLISVKDVLFVQQIMLRGQKRCQNKVPPPPPSDRSFEHLKMDFIELTPSEGKKSCLVIVCMFSKWVEVFPTSK